MNKQAIWVMVMGVVLIGCSQVGATPDSPKVSKAPEQQKDATDTNAAMNTTTGGEEGKGTTGGTTDQKNQDQPERRTKPINGERIYQLNDLEMCIVKFGEHAFRTWIMDTPSKQEEGMMMLNDSEVEADEAMIFVYPADRQMNFWMHNTKIPLDIAFVNSKKKVVSVATMKAWDETTTPSKGPAMYAIEVKAGTFKKIGVKAGQTVDIPAKVKAAYSEE